MIDILFEYGPAFTNGALVTLSMSLAIWTFGISIGTPLGFARAYNFGVFSKLVGLLAWLIGAIPVLVILFWLHYPLQRALGVVIPPIYSVVGVLSVINTLLVSDSVLRATQHVSRQYLDVAYNHGIAKRHILRSILWPLTIRSALPSILITQVAMLHMTIFGSLISAEEIFRTAQRINSIEYRPVEIYTFLALFFLILSAPVLVVAGQIRAKYGRDISER